MTAAAAAAGSIVVHIVASSGELCYSVRLLLCYSAVGLLTVARSLHLCVRVCVCLYPSQDGVLAKQTEGSFWWGMKASFDLSCTVLRRVAKFLLRLCPKHSLDLWQVRRSSQRVVNFARQRWMLSAKNWTVVGRTKLTFFWLEVRPTILTSLLHWASTFV